VVSLFHRYLQHNQDACASGLFKSSDAVGLFAAGSYRRSDQRLWAIAEPSLISGTALLLSALLFSF